MNLSWKAGDFFISCEHASADLPLGAPTLGVSDDALRSHASWDPGALDVARQLADALEAPLLAGDHTRLLADLNRSPDNPSVVPEVAFGLSVPGNQNLSERARQDRIRTYHTPYWNRADEHVRSIMSRQGSCLHIAVHSFTPELDPEARDFDVGLLYDPEYPRELALADRLSSTLHGHGFRVRHNEPYSGTADGLTTAFRKRFAQDQYTSIELELNQGSMREAFVQRVVCTIVDGLRASS